LEAKLILSVSRRTDIPAFYAEWFFNRLKDGYVLARNPFNYRQVSKVSLSPEVIDCIVFWTKDPTKMLDKLDLLGDYKYYFMINPNSPLLIGNLEPEEIIIEKEVQSHKVKQQSFI
jgi:hypothetical protein